MPFLQFKGKTAVESYHRVVPHHVLEIDEKLSLAKKPGFDGNLIIEGDNLIALKSLLPTHQGKIKCVYIDPPYNTGNEGWIYNDNLTQPQFKEWIGKVVGKEGEDATRHDKWCCMMYPRLQLLKDLMHDDGAIFISIDDNEVHHLRAMLDEIFGAGAFVATCVWQKRYSRDNRPALGMVHEYVVIYSKTPGRFGDLRNRLEPSDESRAVYKNPNNDPQGDWRPIPMTAQGRRANQMYEVRAPGGKIHKPPTGRCWSMVESEFKKLKDRGRIWFGIDGNSQPNVIRYWTEVEGFVPWSWWPHEETGHTDEAKKEIFHILGKEDAFDSPKPTRLLERILSIYTNASSDDIVLDSFAGSGTTAHATLKLNNNDGGNRRFILIQQPIDSADAASGNICRDVTRRRVERVATGYKYDDDGEEKRVAGLGGAFAYARVGDRLLEDFRTLGDNPPSYEQMARYIWFTDTSRAYDGKQADKKTHRIGVLNGTSYYLLYSAGKMDAPPADMEFLRGLRKTDKNPRWVIYTERFWAHRDVVREEFPEARVLLVPFQLK